MEKSSAERVDSTFTFVDDRPKISSIDCYNRRGFLDELKIIRKVEYLKVFVITCNIMKVSN